ncbi:MAG: Uma2 family endonuclease [Merismopedia sp. SIO2A8]|nr:Uma2 family endonuclease [Merismopedia sp. SIO2A8]
MVQLPSNAPRALSSHVVWKEKQPPNWDILSEEWLSDEPELESDFHYDQIALLLRLLQWYWRDRSDVYCSANTTVYFDPNQRTNRNFRSPDVYVVFGTVNRPRNSWMVWREGDRFPNVAFEMLSTATAKQDRETKKLIYQDTWKLPNYFWFHPETKEFKGFCLVDGQYEEIQPNAQGYLWSDQMELYVGIHTNGMLRLFSPDGDLILLRAEEAEQQVQQERSLNTQIQQNLDQERQRAEEESQRAEEERQRAERLAARLRQMGLDPDDF